MKVELADSTNLCFDLLTVLCDLGLFSIHTLVQLLERVAFVFKVPILLLQHRLVLVKEAPKILNLGVFQHLEPLEGLGDLLGCRDLGHLRDRLAEQVILTLDQSFIVPQ